MASFCETVISQKEAVEWERVDLSLSRSPKELSRVPKLF